MYSILDTETVSKPSTPKNGKQCPDALNKNLQYVLINKTIKKGGSLWTMMAVVDY